MSRICLVLALALFLGSIPAADTCALPTKNEWTAPEHSGGGDDDEPILTTLLEREAELDGLPYRSRTSTDTSQLTVKGKSTPRLLSLIRKLMERPTKLFSELLDL